MSLRGVFNFFLVFEFMAYSVISVGSSPTDDEPDPRYPKDPPKGFKGFELNIDQVFDTDKYRFHLRGRVGTFSVKNGFLIKAVRDDIERIWEAEGCSQYANKVVLYGIGDVKRRFKIYLIHGDPIEYRLRQKGEVDKEKDKKSEPEPEGAKGGVEESGDEGASARPVSYESYRASYPSSFSPCPSVSGTPSKRGKMSVRMKTKKLFPAEVKIFTRDSPGPNDESKFIVEKMEGDIYLYKINRREECTRVDYNNQTVWKCGGGPLVSHPDEIYFDPLTNFFILKFGGLINVYSQCRGGWGEDFVGVPVLVDVDIKKKRANSEVDYRKVESTDYASYSAKTGVLIKSVRQRSTVIWTAENAAELVSKVDVYGIGSRHKQVTIHLISGRVRHFNKDKRSGSRDCSWHDGDSNKYKFRCSVMDSKKSKKGRKDKV